MSRDDVCDYCEGLGSVDSERGGANGPCYKCGGTGRKQAQIENYSSWKKDSLAALLRIATVIVSIRDDGHFSWEEKYSLIFSRLRQKLDDAAKELAWKTNYYDPDMGYEDDVRAYCSMAEELAKRAKGALG